MSPDRPSSSKRDRFSALHVPGRPLVMPNPWDAGTARLLESLGFEALATTSSGYAATLGRLDYSVTREEALGHAAGIVAAVDLPVSADLENGFADDPEGVAATVVAAVEVGLAGCSVEDFTGRADDPIYPLDLADIRAVVAAVDRPVNVLLLPGGPTVAQLGEAGVARVSVGGAFAHVALAAVAAAGAELREHGTSGWQEEAAEGRRLARDAFRPA